MHPRVGACPETASNSGDLVGRLSMVRGDDRLVFRTKENDIARFEDSIDVDVPVRIAYDQWTQFESFPEFMEGVERGPPARRHAPPLDGRGRRPARRRDAEITEQTPDMRVAWTSTTGARHAGVVTFHRLDAARRGSRSRSTAEPEGVVETVGATLGFVDRRVKGDLERFR